LLEGAHAATARLEVEMLAAMAAKDRQCFHDQLKASIHALSLTMPDTGGA
jgi:hypothetical protein